MDDIKSMTVRYLRDLARKHLGRGHSKLKTKEELLAALAEHVPAIARLLGKRAAEATAGDTRAPALPRTAPPGAEHTQAAKVVKFPPRAEHTPAEGANQRRNVHVPAPVWLCPAPAIAIRVRC